MEFPNEFIELSRSGVRTSTEPTPESATVGQGGPAGAGVSRCPERPRVGHSGRQVWHRG